MKILSCILIALACGCSSVQKPDAATYGAVVQEATFLTTTELLKSHPEYKPAMALALQSLQQLDSKDTITIDDVWKIVNQLPIKEVKSEQAILAFSGARIVLVLLTNGQQPAIKTNEDFHLIVKGMIAGLNQTLA